MNGAITDPSARTKTTPNEIRNITIGAIHHFLRILKKFHISNKIDSFDIL